MGQPPGLLESRDRPTLAPARKTGCITAGDRTVEAFDRLKQLVAAAEEDVRKAEGGNKAAGTRARQAMQEIKNAAQEVRKKILEVRSSESQ